MPAAAKKAKVLPPVKGEPTHRQDVLIRVKACGIYGSNVHGMDGSTARGIPPAIMGHEASGPDRADRKRRHDLTGCAMANRDS